MSETKSNHKISVVTVCYNAVNDIEETMLSVLNQTYDNIEYIVIDGGSTDGTVDIIKKYSNRLAYWVSEPDKGIYDAMNKGIEVATGDYINFMNAGDYFCDVNTILKLSALINEDTDIIYGDSICLDKNSQTYMVAGVDLNDLNKNPIYRHNSSFVKKSIYDTINYDVTKSKEFLYGLDFNQIWTMYKCGKSFKKINLPIVSYKKEGISSRPIKNKIINFRITHQDKKISLQEKFRLNMDILKYIVLNYYYKLQNKFYILYKKIEKHI